MNFSELTRVMLHSMDFFELRRTAARYGVPYQGVRRNKLIREVERKIAVKNNPHRFAAMAPTPITGSMLLDSDKAHQSAKSLKKGVANGSRGMAPRIKTYSSRNTFGRIYSK